MATGKRYYWIKLKDSFMTSDAVDFLMGQPDGANYVVLYQMLCLKTINTGGRLERHIGEVIIPYDEAKIQRDTKWFSIDTVRVALNLYKALGLIYVDKDGSLALANYENLVGSETDYAAQKKVQRQNKVPELPVDNVHTDVHIEKDIDIRDKDIDIERESNKSSEISNVSEKTEDLTNADAFVCRTKDVRRVMEAWNSLGLGQIKKILPTTNRGVMLRKRIQDYGADAVCEAIEKIRGSTFLMGGNKKGWTITFDWFIKPNNFPKVLEGNYDDHTEAKSSSKIKTPYDGLRSEPHGDDLDRLSRMLNTEKEG